MLRRRLSKTRCRVFSMVWYATSCVLCRYSANLLPCHTLPVTNLLQPASWMEVRSVKVWLQERLLGRPTLTAQVLCPVDVSVASAVFPFIGRRSTVAFPEAVPSVYCCYASYWPLPSTSYQHVSCRTSTGMQTSN